MIKGNVGYVASVDRYVIYGNYGDEVELHCGYGLDVLVNGEWVHTRIEMDGKNEYYLVGCPVTLDDVVRYGLPVRR